MSQMACHAEALQIVQSPHQSREIADAIAVGIHERLDGKAINDGVLVPEVVDHAVPIISVRGAGATAPPVTSSVAPLTKAASVGRCEKNDMRVRARRVEPRGLAGFPIQRRSGLPASACSRTARHMNRAGHDRVGANAFRARACSARLAASVAMPCELRGERADRLERMRVAHGRGDDDRSAFRHVR